MKHVQGPVCPSCEEKLIHAHPTIREWFHQVKDAYQTIHTSCVYRDEVAQMEAFQEGRSHVKWPNSKHNQMPSLAIDLFEITPDGVAKFDPVMMTKINGHFGAALRWGGDFEKLKDFVHFEIKNS